MRRWLASLLALPGLCAWPQACASPTRAAPGPPPDDAPSATATPREVCWSQGRPDGAEPGPVPIRAAQTRALIVGSKGERSSVRFRYLGPTTAHAHLRSGREREQIALKLRVRDTCNGLYATWRLEPKLAVVVSEKRNPTQSAHRECQNRGYFTLRPIWSAPPPRPVVGEVYELSGKIDGDELIVMVNGRTYWRGNVEPTSGPEPRWSGLRSDNWGFELLSVAADGEPEPLAVQLPGCRPARSAAKH